MTIFLDLSEKCHVFTQKDIIAQKKVFSLPPIPLEGGDGRGAFSWFVVDVAVMKDSLENNGGAILRLPFSEMTA